jgi:Protein of unknown function (DUF2510)
MSQPSASPGWYSDPWGRGGQRYWDGRDWTPYASPQGEPLQSRGLYPPQPQYPFPQYRRGRVPGWLIAVVIAVIALVLVIIFVVVEKPWESQQYKDCVRSAKSERILGTQQEIEAFCHQLYG